METRHDDSDGSNIFWPGYVDATTNLILNLLFLLTILIVAVFMFALELGRTSKVKVENPPVVATKPAEEVLSKPITDPVKEILKPVSDGHSGAIQQPVPSLNEDGKVVSKTTIDFAKENVALKREIQRLKKMLAQKVRAGGPVKSAKATSVEPKPQSGVDKTVATDLEITVRFKEEAIALTQEEHDRLLETLKPLVESGKASINVEVPTGFSEAKRMGFYRAMAVRNLLIEMKMPKENIDVSVVEGNNNASSSLVRVRSH